MKLPLTRRCAILIALALVVACGGREQPAASSKLTTLKMNLNPNLQYGPLVIAKEEGFFAAEGIDAELVKTDANSALLAITTGKLDVLSGPVRSGLFNMITRGVPLQVVADRGHSEPGRCYRSHPAGSWVKPPGWSTRSSPSTPLTARRGWVDGRHRTRWYALAEFSQPPDASHLEHRHGGEPLEPVGADGGKLLAAPLKWAKSLLRGCNDV